MMKIATWNVNSIRAREARVLRWLERERPEVLCLQELKVTEDAFPWEPVREAGYHAAVLGEKAYNGVAVLSREEPEDVGYGMDAVWEDDQARLVDVRLPAVRVLSAYFPNGQRVGSPEYTYKLDWIAHLRDYLAATGRPSDSIVLAGDFNVAPDDLDVAFPELWGNSVLCHPSAREALDRLRDWGLLDAVRKHHPEGGVYSWWDYQMQAFQRNNGLRIDHIFATRPVARRCAAAQVDIDERDPEGEGVPSDHAPVIAEFEM